MSVAFITGAGRGQGRAHAVTLAGRGYDVVALDAPQGLTTLPYETASEADLEQTCALVREAGRRAIAIAGDVRKTADIERAVQAATGELGGLDVAIANAGICSFARFDDITDEQWEEMQAVNLGGVFRTLRAALPTMRAQGSGRLLATSSMAGRGGSPNIGHYAAMKAGVISLVKTTAYSLSGTGVRINAVCPGLIETGMTTPIFDNARERGTDAKIGQLNPLKRAGQPHELAAMGLFLASDDASYVNGQAIPVDGGLTASMPYAGKPI